MWKVVKLIENLCFLPRRTKIKEIFLRKNTKKDSSHLAPILRLNCNKACARMASGQKQSFKASVVASWTKDGQWSSEMLACKNVRQISNQSFWHVYLIRMKFKSHLFNAYLSKLLCKCVKEHNSTKWLRLDSCPSGAAT